MIEILVAAGVLVLVLIFGMLVGVRDQLDLICAEFRRSNEIALERELREARLWDASDIVEPRAEKSGS